MASQAGEQERPSPPGPVVVVSPHFDDAVLSCGRVLGGHPGSHVVTVFSAGPWRVLRLPAWDRSSGTFSPGADVMGVRRREDDDALACFGASAHRLGFWDSQYRGVLPRRRRAAAVEAVADRLLALVEDLAVSTWLVPLGLVHPDHVLTARACRQVAARVSQLEWIAYEELPYRVERPELVTAALTRIEEEGWRCRPAALASGADERHKRQAVGCYRSQVAALGPRAALAIEQPEAYHRLVPVARTAA